jgi:ribose 5-phosphate isomerase B
MKILIASDHGGFKLKDYLIDVFTKSNIDFFDFGPKELNNNDDYTDFVFPLAERVSKEDKVFGILICRNGVGVCISANKVKGIKAGISWNVSHAKSSRRDDNTNILCLPADYLDEKDALNIVLGWLDTKFSEEERHLRRLNKINKYESEHLK